jgi:hypothetical protein
MADILIESSIQCHPIHWKKTIACAVKKIVSVAITAMPKNGGGNFPSRRFHKVVSFFGALKGLRPPTVHCIVALVTRDRRFPAAPRVARGRVHAKNAIKQRYCRLRGRVRSMVEHQPPRTACLEIVFQAHIAHNAVTVPSTVSRALKS